MRFASLAEQHLNAEVVVRRPIGTPVRDQVPLVVVGWVESGVSACAHRERRLVTVERLSDGSEMRAWSSRTAPAARRSPETPPRCDLAGGVLSAGSQSASPDIRCRPAGCVRHRQQRHGNSLELRRGRLQIRLDENLVRDVVRAHERLDARQQRDAKHAHNECPADPDHLDNGEGLLYLGDTNKCAPDCSGRDDVAGLRLLGSELPGASGGAAQPLRHWRSGVSGVYEQGRAAKALRTRRAQLTAPI